MRFVVQVLRKILIATISLLLPVAAIAQRTSNYPLIDSHVASIGAPVLSPVWLDHDRVAFAGIDHEKIVGGRKFSEYKRPSDARVADTLYTFDQFVWNVRTGEVRRAERPMRYLCAHDGQVGYLSEEPSDDPVWYWYSGVYGKENRQPFPKLPERYWINPHSCRFYTSEPPWNKVREKGHVPVPLLERHGFIDLGSPKFDGGSPVLVPSDSPDAARKLTQLWGSEDQWRFRYVPFVDAYVVDKAGSSPTAFLMNPSGTLMNALFPPNSPRKNGPILYTRQGYFYSNIEARNNVEDTTTAGGYLLADGRLVRIVVGYMHVAGVSPDGCRLAFSHAPSAKAHYDGLKTYQSGGLSNTTMKAIDLCKPES